jgi:cytoskeletal protein CcmA (bactofilin family)
MQSFLPLTVLALFATAGCFNASDQSTAANADVTASDTDTNTVNGSIRVPAGKKSGDVATVNGAIRVDNDATLSAARTVNGDIQVGDHATVESLHSVNGAITVGTGAHVNETVTSVNGSLTMRADAQVAGAVSNVNGDIVLTSAHVAGGITTVNGDINLKSNSHVEGGILVRRKSSSGWFNWEGSGPRIVIGPGASVQGELRFERKVQLYVSDRATIGPVRGATAIRFSGENPPG